MKVWINVLGCPKNEADSSAVAWLLQKEGHEVVDVPEEADVVVINTCGFIESAKEESIDAILSATRYAKRTIVHGCLVQRYYEALRSEIPEVDAFLGVVKPTTVVETLEYPKDVITKPIPVYDFCGRYIDEKPYAYLKVGDGCNRQCAFCAIPSIKGNLINRSISDIVEEAKYLLEMGKKELVLVSQDLTQYTFKGSSLVDLLRELDSLKGKFWIRLLYLYPDGVSDELLNVVKNSRHIVRYFDVPVQHASKKILRLMNRNENILTLKRLFESIRDKMPDAILRSTVIVGFPQESGEDFKALVNFVKEIRFDRLGAFVYSDEEGTKAYELDGKVPKNLARKRFNALMRIQQKISLEKNEKLIGKHIEVLVEGKEGELYFGRTYMDAPDIDGYVHFKSDRELKVGEFVDVRITDYEFYDLEGEA